jgi:hypothetical protein
MKGGKYELLHAYLRDRFADRIVLTFNEIEALIGSPLPDAARRESAWWSTAGASDDSSEQSEAWTLANRRAEVSVAAQRVVFDRDLAPSTRAQAVVSSGRL